ncbi:DEKNAAC104015 [Brettanomyces naardenensis]|uniref:DNA-directed RNA polymerase III subunit RPC9 n=1 Tax=Brettanomyces naardenensis TaxID=13370 RepID=A0A448YQ48_BRENA|nr:DEKNAAC104015 [Brettanomyces naardenensis]
MKVEVARDKLLSNYEVYEHLVEIQKENSWSYSIPDDGKKEGKRRKKRKVDTLIDLEIITKDLSRYLVQNSQSNDTKVEKIVNLMLGLNMYKLERIEKLQILNLLPRSLVLLYAIIEDCDQRFTEEQCEDLLSLVSDNFPPQDGEDGQMEVIEDGEEKKDGRAKEKDEEEEEEEEEEELITIEEDEIENIHDELEHEVAGKKVEKEIDE